MKKHICRSQSLLNIFKCVICFPHEREIPFACALVFCLTLRTEDSDRDLRCPVMSNRPSWSLSGSSVENLASQHRILAPREGCFRSSQQPIPLSRDNGAGFARWMPVASFQQDHWLRSPTSLATNAQLFPMTFAIGIGLTLFRTASVRFHFLNRLYQTDPWVSLHAYRFASRTVRGSSGSNGPAQWACGMCTEYCWNLTNSIPPNWHGCIQCARKRQKWFPRQNLLEEKNFLSFQFPSIQYQIYLVKTK